MITVQTINKFIMYQCFYQYNNKLLTYNTERYESNTTIDAIFRTICIQN